MLTFYYSQFSPPLSPIDAVAALPDSFIYLFIYFPPAQSGRTRMCPFHWSTPSEIYRCCSKRLQRAHKRIVLTRRLSTSAHSLSIGVMCEAGRAKERSDPSTAWADPAVQTNNWEANYGELPAMHHSENKLE